jgi:tripartite-type tricarboxylate transporter receptor subunit TctC
MKSMRSGFLVSMLSIVFLSSGVIRAQSDYPSKPIEFLIPFEAGGSADLMGRALANGSEKAVGQPIVAINRPGAGGGIMYTALKNAKPDGYTVGWNSTSILTSTNIGNVPFDYTAFAHVCRIGYEGMALVVKADSAWKTFQEFVDHAKKNPGKIKIGNAGTGSGTHLAAVMMEKAADIRLIHVPLGAQRRVPSLLGGEMDAICVPLVEAAAQVTGGAFRILATSTEARDPVYKDAPTLKELGYDVVIELFRGISVPKGTPKEAIQKLEEGFKKGSESEAFVKISKQNGFNIDFMGSNAFEKYLKVQNEMVAQAMKLGGLIK